MIENTRARVFSARKCVQAYQKKGFKSLPRAVLDAVEINIEYSYYNDTRKSSEKVPDARDAWECCDLSAENDYGHWR